MKTKDLAQRRKNIDLNQLSPEKVRDIGVELGKQVGEILGKALEEANKLAGVYGLEIKLNMDFVPKKSEEQQENQKPQQ